MRYSQWQGKLEKGMIVLMLLLLTGCSLASRPMVVRSSVDALAASPESALQNKRFFIVPDSHGVSEHDLQFIEFRSLVERALLNRGYFKASSVEDSNVLMFLRYGVSAPEMVIDTYDVPMWTGMGGYWGPGWGWGHGWGPGWGWWGPGMGMGMMGRTQHISASNIFRRFLTLSACEAEAYRTQQQRLEIWRVNVESRGTSNDLRLIFPYMVAAMQPHIGMNTGHMVTIDIEQSDLLLKGLSGQVMPQP